MYKIDRNNLKKEKSFHMTFFYAGFFFFAICNAAIIANWMGIDTGAEGDLGFAFILCNILTGLFMWIGISGAQKVDEKNKRYDILERSGSLVKGLPYHMVSTGASINDCPVMAIAVDFQLESGSVVKLISDGRFDRKHADKDGLVDVLIDPNDPNNYFIDFEINEYDGFENRNPIKY